MWEVFAQSPEPEAHVKNALPKGIYVWVSTSHIVWLHIEVVYVIYDVKVSESKVHFQRLLHILKPAFFFSYTYFEPKE